MQRKKCGHRRRYAMVKRALDVVLSGLLLLFLWGPMLLIGCLIRLTSRGRAIFRQERVGRNGKPFVCYKFRTMTTDAPSDQTTAEFADAARYITPIGRFLRRSSLDELPQLWNVLVGDMSLVGPRPLIPKEETVHALRRRPGVYQLRPGVTGLAQISGRDRLCDREKVRLDARYARTVCLKTDLGILWKTLSGVVVGKDVADGRSVEERIHT